MRINLTRVARQIQKSVRLVDQIQKAKIKATGDIGEFVFDEVAKTGLNRNYHLLSDVVLEAGVRTTQIDQVIVSQFGIFVVEIKAYKGWIFGNPRDAKWTQTLTNAKHAFQNPLRQNHKHIKALQNLLELPDNIFKSLIVFSGEVQFKTPMPDNVVRGAAHYIDYILKFKAPILHENQVEDALGKIQSNRLSSADHRVRMEKAKERCQNADPNDPPPCRRCGRNMVLRTARSGQYEGRQFWGCAGFPDCKAIVNIEQDLGKTIEEEFKNLEEVFSTFF